MLVGGNDYDDNGDDRESERERDREYQVLIYERYNENRMVGRGNEHKTFSSCFIRSVQQDLCVPLTNVFIC